MALMPADLDDVIARALAEDVGPGDVTSQAVLSPDAYLRGELVMRHEGVVAGLPVAERVFQTVGTDTRMERLVEDGQILPAGEAIANLDGNARAILAAERVALNFLTHLSGVATLTRQYVEACSGTESVILCTRKTTPGLRALERYAVEVGGGRLHRAGLFDGILIKDNHVAAAGGVGSAVREAKRNAAHTLNVEVEVENLEELEEALEAGADAILLDNPDLDTVKRALDLAGDRVPLEVSGGMTVDRVREIAGLGKLLISVGRLTHSAPALDISLDSKIA